MTFGSLFAGIGGFDLGLERAGMECQWQVEIDDYATKVLEKHWTNVKRYKDVRECGGHNLEPIDLICGGFPCQDLSVAGKRAGLKEGTRSGLWFEFARILGELRPRFALVENVPGLLDNHAMGRVLGELAEIGYDAEWDCIPASAVGAPHQRDRVWILATDSKCKGLRISSEQDESRQRKSRTSRDGDLSSLDSSDNRSKRTQRFWTGQIQRVEEFSWCQNVRRVEDLRERSDIPEPIIRGGRNGIPYRVDRLRCLGNAVVPQIVEWIGKKIIEACFERRGR